MRGTCKKPVALSILKAEEDGIQLGGRAEGRREKSGEMWDKKHPVAAKRET